MMCYIYNKVKCRIGRVVMACLGLCLLASCSSRVVVDKQLSESPKIFPDYQNVTIPSQMAPLHFRVEKEPGEVVAAIFSTDDGKSVTVQADDTEVCIGEGDWKNLITSASRIEVQVVVRRGENNCGLKPFSIHVSPDSIDPYMAYRLIEPGYEQWYKMGIYQRCLSDYSQSPILENTVTGNNCMN